MLKLLVVTIKTGLGAGRYRSRQGIVYLVCVCGIIFVPISVHCFMN